MYILKEGKIPVEEYKFSCKRCGCEFMANHTDKNIDQRDGDYVICPTCDAWIDWSLGIKYSKPDVPEIVVLTALIKETHEIVAVRPMYNGYITLDGTARHYSYNEISIIEDK